MNSPLQTPANPNGNTTTTPKWYQSDTIRGNIISGFFGIVCIILGWMLAKKDDSNQNTIKPLSKTDTVNTQQITTTTVNLTNYLQPGKTITKEDIPSEEDIPTHESIFEQPEKEVKVISVNPFDKLSWQYKYHWEYKALIVENGTEVNIGQEYDTLMRTVYAVRTRIYQEDTSGALFKSLINKTYYKYRVHVMYHSNVSKIRLLLSPKRSDEMIIIPTDSVPQEKSRKGMFSQMTYSFTHGDAGECLTRRGVVTYPTNGIYTFNIYTTIKADDIKPYFNIEVIDNPDEFDNKRAR